MKDNNLYRLFPLIFLIFSLFHIIDCEHGIFVETVTWQTQQGELLGTRFRVGTKNVFKFKRVPFAEPPVGDLRFRKPVAKSAWTGTLNATEYGPSCIQEIYANDVRLIPNTITTEDCLHLNIFINRSLTKERKLATMIWVHGGSFTNGQGTMFDGSVLALRGDVIVVTINYRLNVFGMFYGDGPITNGNFGIWDQQQAFRWVKDNIADYGGDPNNITIFGESAGSFAVTLHAILPSNYGLFQRVIAESGSIIQDVAQVTDTNIAYSFQIAMKLGCVNSSNQIDFPCLRTQSASAIFSTYNKVMATAKRPLSPVAWDDHMTKTITERLDDKTNDIYKMFHSIDILVGTNTGEAGLMYFELNSNAKVQAGITFEILCNDVVDRYVKMFYENCKNIKDVLCNRYSPAQNSTLDETTQNAANFYTDFLFLAPTVNMLNHHASVPGRSTYQYLFSHTPKWELIQQKPRWLKGPNHASELTFVFGLDWYPHDVNISTEERNLSNRMIDYWTNFAKTG